MKPIECTEEEILYFNNVVTSVLTKLNINIDIKIMNHENVAGHEKALGIHWKYDDGSERITIDDYFIHECFVSLDKPYMNITGENLISCICHELAHIKYRYHCKAHKELTNKYYMEVLQNEPNN